MNHPKKKNVLAVLAGVAVTAAVAASAATLGGLYTERVGAEDTTVNAPITEGVDLTWQTSYDAEAGHYVVDGVDLDAREGAIPDGAKVQITLKDANGDPLVEYLSTDGGDSYSGGSVPASDVESAAVIILAD